LLFEINAFTRLQNSGSSSNVEVAGLAQAIWISTLVGWWCARSTVQTNCTWKRRKMKNSRCRRCGLM